MRNPPYREPTLPNQKPRECGSPNPKYETGENPTLIWGKKFLITLLNLPPKNPNFWKGIGVGKP